MTRQHPQLQEPSSRRSTEYTMILSDVIQLPIREEGVVLSFSDGRTVVFDHESNMISLNGLHKPSENELDHFVSEWGSEIEKLGCGLERAMNMIAEVLPMIYGRRIYEVPRVELQNSMIDKAIALYCVELLADGALPTTRINADKAHAVTLIGALIWAKKLLDSQEK